MEGYLSPLSLQSALRLGQYAPAVVKSWVNTLSNTFDQARMLGALGDFAFSLLPAYATVDSAAAGDFLGRLLDLHVAAVAHETTQGTVEHLRIFRAFSLPSHPSIDAQLERMIRACPDDESLTLAVEAALRGGRREWLQGFVERETATRRTGRTARARYLSALAGLQCKSIDSLGSWICDAAEDRAREVEAQRQTFLDALERWQRARTPRQRFLAEITLFDAISGFHLPDMPSLGHGELGELLNARLSHAWSEAANRLSPTLFGWTAAPAWMSLGNVPPRCRVLPAAPPFA